MLENFQVFICNQEDTSLSEIVQIEGKKKASV